MTWKLEIGSYVLDTANVGSSSTTSGAILGWNPEEGWEPTIAGDQFIWPEFWIYIEPQASAAVLEAAIKEIQDTFNSINGKNVTLKDQNGDTILEMKAVEWPEVVAVARVDPGDRTAKIVIESITGSRPGGVSGGSADEPGQIGALSWSYEISSGGLAALVANGTFGPIDGGAGARQNAEAWRFKLLSSSNYPSFLKNTFRQVDAMFMMDQQPEQAAIGEASFNPCTCTIMFRELPADVASALPNEVIACDAKTTMVPRPPLNTEANQDPGHDLVLSGTITLKIQGSTSWEPGETRATQQQTYDKLKAAAEALRTDFFTRYARFQITQLGEGTIDIDSVAGVCGFQFKFTTAEKILKWDENLTIRNQARKIYDEITDGSTVVHEQAGGDLRTLTHEFSVISIGSPVPYNPPTLQSQWDQFDAAQDYDAKFDHGEGTILHHVRGSTAWRWVQETPQQAQNRGRSTANRSFDKGSIANGRI